MSERPGDHDPNAGEPTGEQPVVGGSDGEPTGAYRPFGGDDDATRLERPVPPYNPDREPPTSFIMNEPGQYEQPVATPYEEKNKRNLAPMITAVLVAILLGLGIGWFLFAGDDSSDDNETTTTTTEDTTTTSAAPTTTGAPAAVATTTAAPTTTTPRTTTTTETRSSSTIRPSTTTTTAAPATTTTAAP